MPALPSVLAKPPWRRAQAPSAPVSAARMPPPAPSAPAPAPSSAEKPSLVWAEGERERFRGKPPPKLTEAAEEKLFERLLDDLDKKTPLRGGDVVRLGDDKLAELADELGPTTVDAPTMKVLLGRLGEAFAAQAVAIVRAAPRERGLFEAAMPIHSPELAYNAAASFFERELPASFEKPFLPSAAESWMLRFPDAVASGLAGAAADPAHHGHRAARAALGFVATHGHLDAMRAALSADVIAWLEPLASLAPLASRPEHSWAAVLAARGQDHRALALLGDAPEARAYAARVREGDAQKQLEAVPEAVAPLPAFFDAAALPAPELVSGEPLPEEAVRALGEMLRFSPLLHPYIGVAQVREACRPESLDAFALALFERWAAAGEDPRDVWALESCGKIGGEAAAREVAARVRAWARGAEPPRYGWDDDSHRTVLVSQGSRGFSYARTGCAVLAAQGTNYARMLLDDLARTGVQIWLRKEASRALGGADVPHDEIDALVPTVGLDPDGSATFDLGPRAFRVHFDEGLTPYLVDAQGGKQSTFPRSRKDDDAAKYAAAKERFAAIAKDTKTVARYQVALLERAMCKQRAFSAADFRERFIAHPLLRHLGRRVVWSAGEASFRVAEDGTLADAHDATFDLGNRAVTVAHPAAMDKDSREAWRTRFADYEIVQPFPQLGREIFVRSASEIGEQELPRFAGRKATRGRLFQLARRGWRARFDRDDVTEYTCELPGGATARFEVSPPVVRDGAEETFTVVLAKCSLALDRLPPIDYSELVRDLEYACTP